MIYSQSRNFLFVCSKNQWRSPTAEAVFRKYDGLNVRSAGTSRAAKRRVTARDLEWADIVFVMEQSHKSRLNSDFRGQLMRKPIHILDIEDDYNFMDSELIAILKAKIAGFL